MFVTVKMLLKLIILVSLTLQKVIKNGGLQHINFILTYQFIYQFLFYQLLKRQRLPRVFHRHLPWEGFSDEELVKRCQFGRKSLLFKQDSSKTISNSMTQRNHAILKEELLVIALRFFR